MRNPTYMVVIIVLALIAISLAGCKALNSTDIVESRIVKNSQSSDRAILHAVVSSGGER
jgi:hypothetical protein